MNLQPFKEERLISQQLFLSVFLTSIIERKNIVISSQFVYFLQ